MKPVLGSVEEGFYGFGEREEPEFEIVQDERGVIHPIHIAFLAKSQKEVELFYETALLMGARDNGAPGLRLAYGPTYYAAFFLDPNGHNIEAVTFSTGE